MESPSEDFSRRFAKDVGRPIRKRVLLSRFSNFNIGGPADYFFQADTLEELVNALRISRREKIRSYVIGGGYNMLFDDRGYRGLIIKNKTKQLDFSGSGLVETSSGTALEDFLAFCVKFSVGGFEFLAGIPGTVGGAIFGNAGAFGESIGDRLVEADLLNGEGQRICVRREDMGFGYRHSRLKARHDVLLQLRLEATPGSSSEIEARIEKNLEWRRMRHPRDVACAGSYFKNPCPPGGQKKAAAYYLERVGAKGMCKGGAEVSLNHANFILNTGGARASEVLDLASELKKRVWERFGIRLEEEVIFLPEDGAMP
jgi:UDP-N-acetylmuramate dehydrogenase